MSVSHADSHFLLKSTGLLRTSPWSVLNKIWIPAIGYPAEDFRVTEGKTPMTTIRETAIVIISYYFIIYTGREYMKNRPPFRLKDLFLLHNLFLTVLSGALLVLFVEQLAPTIWNHGIFYSICGSGGWTQQLATLYYLNYLTKYVELLDTIFLVLKKKPLTFLHCYHHGATALLCYTQLIGHTPVSWVPITLNLTVHVVMYWYYFQSARGVRIWWKEWITKLQIMQFVIDLGFIYFATYNYYSSAYMPVLPHMGTCAGEEYAAFAGCVILSSYLVLFISFYYATYRKAGKNDQHVAKKAIASLETKRVPDLCETSEMASGAASGAMEAANGALKATRMISK